MEVVQGGIDVFFFLRTLKGEFFVASIDVAADVMDFLNLEGFPDGRGHVSAKRSAQILARARSCFADLLLSLRTTSGAAILDPGRWRAADVGIELERAKAGHEAFKATGLKASRWILTDIKPNDLYVYLQARFGQANGAMSLVRANDSDNLFHWQYSMSAGDEWLSFTAATSRIEVSTITERELTKADRAILVRNVKADLAKWGSEMAAVRKRLEDWTLITNPFAQLRKQLEKQETSLKSLRLAEPYPLRAFTTRADFEAHHAAQQEWLSMSADAFGLSSAILSLAPVLGESFVNLVIFILARDDIKADERLYADVFRRQIDVRLRELHITCPAFAHALDPKHNAFAQFHALMNDRNDRLHGNVNPSKLKVDDVFFDGTVPVFKETISVTSRIGRQMFGLAPPSEALAALEVVRAFVDYTISCLKPEVQPQVRQLLGVDPLGYRKDTGRVGILFGNALGEIAPLGEE